MDVHTREQRSKNMRAIKSSETKMEVRLAKALWVKGHRYRKNNKKVFGKPDLTFRKLRIAVFVDSEFFHGKNWKTEKYRIKTNRDFWWKKIERNMERDREVNEKLSGQGWKIFRFWSLEIKKDLDLCVSQIEEEIRRRNNA